MDACIGNKYVELIERTECIGNSLLKINGNFATLDTQLCTLDDLFNRMVSIEGIVKIEAGEAIVAESGVDYYKPGDPLNSSLDVIGNISCSQNLVATGNTILNENVTIGSASSTSTISIRGNLQFETPLLKKSIQLLGNQINAGPLTNAEDTLLINYTGYGGSTTYFRNLNVCDGKQSSLLYVDSANSRVGVKTTSPAATFHIAGDLKVDGAIISDAPLNPDITVNLGNISTDSATEGELLTYKGGAVQWAPLVIPAAQIPESFSGTGLKIFDTPGAWTWTCPPNINRVTIEIYGAGGGGSSTDNPDTNSSPVNSYYNDDRGGWWNYNYRSFRAVTSPTPRGGGGGGHAAYTVSVVPGTTYNLYVGAGGAGGTIPTGWIGSSPNSTVASNSNHRGADGGDSWCAIGGTTITATGGKGGGSKKTFTLQSPNTTSIEVFCGGDGGSVPLVSPYVGAGTGGVYSYYSSSRGTGSSGGYGGESGGLRKGGGSGIFSCGGLGGSYGSLTSYDFKTIDGSPVNGWYYVAANYQSALDSQWRDGAKYGGGGAAARAAIRTYNRVTRYQSGVSYYAVDVVTSTTLNTEVSFSEGYIGTMFNGNSPSYVPVDYYKAGNGANGAVIIRY